MQSKKHNAEIGMRGAHWLSPSSSTPATLNLNPAAAPRSRIGAPSQRVHGFVGKKTQDPKALNLLVAASEFATAAMSRLGQDAPGTPSAPPHLIDRYVDTVFGLEVHFLFPNLSAEKRDLLVAIMKVRNSISAILNGASRNSSAAEKASPEQLTAELQRKFLEFRSQILESGIREQLNPVQKKVFQDEFFSITLDKRCSTTLFFSTDIAPRADSVSCGIGEPEVAVKSDSSFRRALPDGIPALGRPFQEECLEPHRPMQGQPAQPVIDRDVAFHLPDVTPQLAEQRLQRGKTVLLISADTGAQDLVGHALRQAGYSVLVANAGFTGYLTAMRERPDLVLVDLSLSLEVSGPDACLDGRGVMKMLSKLPSSRALTFIGLVSNGASEIEAQVLGLGAKACLLKPLDSGLLLGAVQNAWVDRPSVTDEATPSTWTVSASV